jgi:hypothetical protein
VLLRVLGFVFSRDAVLVLEVDDVDVAAVAIDEEEGDDIVLLFPLVVALTKECAFFSLVVKDSGGRPLYK